MTTNRTISEDEAQQNLSELVKRTKGEMERFVLTRDGRPEAVLMSYEDYEDLIETLELLSNPDEVREIQKIYKDMDDGNYATYEEVFGKPPPEK